MKLNLKKYRIILIILAVILIAAIAGMLLTAKKESETVRPEREHTAAESAETTQAPTEVPTEDPTVPTAAPTEPVMTNFDIVELVDGQIQTPYGVLNYPEGLADHLLIVNTAEEPYTLAFYAIMEEKTELRLFDISLGQDSGGNMGIVKTALGEVPLNVTIYTLEFDDTWKEEEIITAQAMQDVVNEMIDQMAPRTEEARQEAPVISQQPQQTVTVNNLEIVTPVCTLYYPIRWSSTLHYEYDDSQEGVYKVRFFGQVGDEEKIHLFSIYIGGDEGEQIGAVMGQDGIPVPVNVIMAELVLEGWSPENAEILYSMQEDANQLIEKLPLLD